MEICSVRLTFRLTSMVALPLLVCLTRLATTAFVSRIALSRIAMFDVRSSIPNLSLRHATAALDAKPAADNGALMPPKVLLFTLRTAPLSSVSP